MRLKKICIVLFVIIALSFVCMDTYYNVYAFDKDEMKSMLTENVNVDTNVSSKITRGTKVVLDIIRVAGFGIAMIMITAFGIKYMSTMPAERAQMMKQSMVYVLGAFLLFGASVLVGIISKIVLNATDV